MTTEPKQQEFSPCPWHPGKLCSGECQYILRAGECIHDIRIGGEHMETIGEFDPAEYMDRLEDCLLETLERLKREFPEFSGVALVSFVIGALLDSLSKVPIEGDLLQIVNEWLAASNCRCRVISRQ